MPVEVQEKVISSQEGVAADQVSQTSRVSNVATDADVKEAKSDRNNAWVWYIVGIIDVLLVLRILFYLFGARATGFADLLYGVTRPLVAPFRGIFPYPNLDGSYFDTAALVAIVVYVLIGWLVTRLIDLATRPAGSSKI